MDHQKYVGSDEDIRQLMQRRERNRPDKRTPEREFPIPRHKSGERFIRGPIPWEWLRLALSVGGKAANLSLALWYLIGLKRVNPFRLTNKTISEFGLTPKTARRLLLAFEAKGLIEVDRQRGRGPDVTILDPSERKVD